MKEELKTLQELKIRRITPCPDVKIGCLVQHFVDCIDIKELKAEAIKRWKFARKKGEYLKSSTGAAYWRGKMDELRDFFDLTEEDLK